MAHPVPDSLKPRRELLSLAATLIALLLLAGASWLLSHLSLGMWATPVALTIAAVKALLIAFIFMRLWSGTVAARFAIGIAFAFISLLTAGVLADVLMR